MNILNEQITSIQDLKVEERARYTNTIALVMAALGLGNALWIIISALLNNAFFWTTYAEAGAILVFVIVLFWVAQRIRQQPGDTLPAYVIIAGLITLLTVRNLVTANAGLLFGIILVAIVTTVATLILPTRRVGFAITAGYIASAFNITLDYYIPYYRPPLQNQIGFSTGIAAAAIFVVATVVIVRQFKNLSLYTKVSFLLTISIIIPIAIIGVVSNLRLQDELTRRQNETLLGAATQTNIQLEAFVQNNLTALRVEGQLPELATFVKAVNSGKPIPEGVNQSAQTILRTLNRKDAMLIISYGLYDLQGNNLLDTNPTLEHQKANERGWFQQVLATSLPAMSSVEFDGTLHEGVMVFAAPVRDEKAQVVGVIREVYNAYKLQLLIQESSSMEGSESFAAVLDSNGTFLAHGLDQNLILKSAITLTPIDMARLQIAHLLPPGTLGELTLNLDGMADGLANANTTPIFYANSHPAVKPVLGNTFNLTAFADTTPHLDTIAAIPMRSTHWVVIFAQSQEAYLNPLRNQTRAITITSVFILVIASIASLGVAQMLANPIAELTRVANRIIEGETSARAEVRSSDEIGALANTFNIMTSQMRDLIGTLESRVAERTKAIEKRARQLQTAAEIGRLAANLRSTDELLHQAVVLISERFGFYHAGIFIVDERREYAVLRAANSLGGQRMLARGHKLLVGQVGIVGYVTARGAARIALDVGDDAIYSDNPDLPETRSELALPLIAGGRVIGALDVQSREGNAFSDEDIVTLQVLADLLTIAIENARLFEENQRSLTTARNTIGEFSLAGWQQIVRDFSNYGFLAASDSAPVPISDKWDEAMQTSMQTNQIVLGNDDKTANIPIMVRGQAIGAIRLRKPESSRRWSKAELDTAQSLADQLSTALDGARLYQEAQRRALVEQAISTVSNRMESAQDVENIMKTAVEEIGALLGDTKVSIRLNPKTDDSQDA